MSEDMPPTPFTSETPSMPEPAPANKRRKLVGLVLAVMAVLLLGAASAYLLLQRHPVLKPSKQTLTFYYRDGKTVLWQAKAKGGELETGAPAFVVLVQDELRERFGYNYQAKGEWRVVTTLDSSLQKTAEERVAAGRQDFSQQGATNVALMAEDVTNGQIVSWVGGLETALASDKTDTVRRNTQAGTLMLPLTYAAFIEGNNAGAGTVIEDTQEPLPGYPCTQNSLTTGNCLYNFDREYLGRMTLRQALGALRLVPAVKAMVATVPNDNSALNIDSINKTLAFAKGTTDEPNSYSCYMAGVDVAEASRKDQTQCFTSAAHGAGLFTTPKSILQSYATLANNGGRVPQSGLLKAELNGKVAYDWQQPKGKQALRADTAYIISDILSDPNASYMTKKKDLFATNGTKLSIISGVTSDATVASAVTYSTRYAVGFWAFGDDQGIKGFSDALTLPITSGWMSVAHAGKNYAARAKPAGLKELPAPVITLNTRTGVVGPSPATDFYPSWYK